MKNSKLRRALLLLASAVLLVCLSVGATLAYLTAEDEVTNTFTVGDVEIKLDEAYVYTEEDTDDSSLVGTAMPGAERVQENEYHLLPNMTYDKDPTVTVLGGSERFYVRMKVTANVEALAGAFGDTYVVNGVFDLGQLVRSATGERNHTDWVWYGYDNGTYEFRYAHIVDARDDEQVLPALFTQIVMPGDISNEKLALLEGLEINIVAEAIQADGFDNEAAAWAAWQ